MAEIRGRTETRPSALKCAIYTRKSSEEGLDQEFNSLDAQREACEAFIKSQRHEGWQALEAYYDDGGISGGTMERPALKRLLVDIQEGRVNIVVVYKVDRLTRSLADFAKIVEIFDKAGASFVSVTQQFNTTSSMGRLTLNVLLSFAQFEREVTGERIRDKIAASKKKGMWMGGNLPLGYDSADRKLIVNSDEAELVRHIYQRYTELASVDELCEELKQQGVVSKVRQGQQGRMLGGIPFARGTLYHLLQNRVYLGEIQHKEAYYPGNHDAIVSAELWEQVRTLTAQNRTARKTSSNALAPSLLAGLLYDDKGERLTASHSQKGGKRYRYYVTNKNTQRDATSRNLRIPAGDLESLVLERLDQFLSDREHVAQAVSAHYPDAIEQQSLLDKASLLAKKLTMAASGETRTILLALISQIEIGDSEIAIFIDSSNLAHALRHHDGSMIDLAKAKSKDNIKITITAQLKRAGLGMRLIVEGASKQQGQPNASILKLLAKAQRYQSLLINGNGQSLAKIAGQEGVSATHFTHVLRVSLLPPAATTQLLEGKHSRTITSKALLSNLMTVPCYSE